MNLEGVLFHFSCANQGELWLLFDVDGGFNSSSQTFRVCSQSGPSVTAVSKWKKCKWNKIKQNCFNTPAPASQSELAHLDKCQRYQMAFPLMLGTSSSV